MVLVVGLSLTVTAQRGGGDKKPPPKDPDRPVVVPRDKPPRGGDKPKPDNRDRDNRGRPQRPDEMSYVIFVSASTQG